MYPYGLGLNLESKDDRDLFLQHSPLIHKKTRIFDSIDLRNLQGPIMNQGSLGSCTGFALAGLRIFLENKYDSYVAGVSQNRRKLPQWYDKILNCIGIYSSNYLINYSPLFLYYEIRKKEDNLGLDSGGTIRTGMKILRAVGVCPERVWPYVERKLNVEPPGSAYRVARGNQILGYYKIPNDKNKIENMEIALSNKLVIVGGITLFDGIYRVRTDGKITYPTPQEAKLGDHALLFVGYNKIEQYFIIRNSWGEEWGHLGYGYIPYDYANDYSNDLWVADEWE